MAAVDRRMGLVRRGATPAAPKPINLPSQKLENHSLFPEVELVPRGTCCWGRAGRSIATNIPSKDTTDLAPLHSENNGAMDDGTVLPNDLAASDDEQSSSNHPLPAAESQGSPKLTTSETNDEKVDSGSSAASDAGSLPAVSVAPASSAESHTILLGSPVVFEEKTQDNVAKVEVQEDNEVASVDCCEGFENPPNFETVQGTHFSTEAQPGLQDFGYFEGFYNSHNSMFSPGMTYSDGPGMAFVPGSHPDPSQHYSFLGVPYYDSAKDKEIVVITMVGNPGFHGNSLPHFGFSDQHDKHMVHGNFPLQFGHFDHFALPEQNMNGRQRSSAEVNPWCSGEQGDFPCYEQGYHKEGWLNGSAMGDFQRGNGTYVLSPSSMCKSGYVPKRGRRQKQSNNRNERPVLKEVSSAALKPERRVTLLTKVSQHEVVISSVQQTGKAVEHGQVAGFPDVTLSENFMEPSCASPREITIASACEVVNIEKSSVKTSVPELSSTPESLLASKAQEEMSGCHQDTAVASFLGAAYQVLVAPDTSSSEVTVKKAKPTSEARWVTFNGDGHGSDAAEPTPGASLNGFTKPATLGKQENERGKRKETTGIRTPVLLSHEPEYASALRLQDKKNTKKWKRKEFIIVTSLEQEHCNSEAQEAGVEDKKALSSSPSDKISAGSDLLPDANVERKALLQYDASLCSSLSGVHSVTSGKNIDAAGPIDCNGPDCVSKANKRKKSFKSMPSSVGLEKVQASSPVQVSEISNKVALRTQPVVEAQGSYTKNDFCRSQEWRPKIRASKHGKSTTKVPCNQGSKHAKAINISEPKENEPCSADIHVTPKHTLEVSIGDERIEKAELQQQDDSHVLSFMVGRQESAKKMSSNCATGFDSNKSTENRGEVEFYSKTWPLKCGAMEQSDSIGKPSRKLSWQQKPLASKPGRSKYTGGGNRPINNETSYLSRVGSRSTEASKVSKVPKPGNFCDRALCYQSVPSLNTEEKSKCMEDSLCPRDNSCSHSMQTQNGKFTNLTKVANQCSKAAPKLLQQSSVQDNQEPKQKLVREYFHQHAEPGHLMKKYQHTGSVARSLPSFVIDSMKQDCYVASCEERRGGIPLHNSWNERFGWNSNLTQEKQLMYRWQKQKVWKSKSLYIQVQQTAAVTHSSVSKPREDCCTISEGKPEREKKQQISALEGSARVSQKLRKASPVQVFKEKAGQGEVPPTPAPPLCVSGKPHTALPEQVSKEKSKEASQDIPPPIASPLIRAQEECVVMESSLSATMYSSWGDKQQDEKQAVQVSLSQEKESTKVCPVADPSIAPSSPSCENEQQADKIGQQGTTSEYGKASDDLPALVSCVSGGSWHDMTEADDTESLKPASQMKMGLEEYSVVISSGGDTSFTQVNGQQIDKQSCKSALEMKLSTEVKKVWSSVERAVFGIASQPASAVTMSLKLKITPPTRKPPRNYTSWRPKSVSGKMAVNSVVSNEMNENDPSPSPHIEGTLNKGVTNVLPANKFTASNDLHVWKNNERHSIRAAYGLPYRRKDFLHLHAPLRHQGKHLTEDASVPGAPAVKEKKLSSLTKQTQICHWEYPVPTLKFSQHHVFAVKQGNCMSNQYSAVGNRRPFSTKSNLPQDDNKKLVQDQQRISRMCAPIEFDYRRPSSANSNSSYDDNKRAVRHQPSLLHEEHFKVKENFYGRGFCHPLKGRNELNPRHGQLRNGRKFTDFTSDKRGWVVKTESRSGPCHLPASVKV